MNFTCPKCSAEYSLTREQFPPGRTLRFSCRSCGSVIRVRQPYHKEGSEPSPAHQGPQKQPPPPIHPAIAPWHVIINDVQRGPFSTDQVSTLLRDLQIDRHCHAWRDGMDNWTPLGMLDEFKYLANSLGDASWRDTPRETPDYLPSPSEAQRMVSASSTVETPDAKAADALTEEVTAPSEESPELSPPPGAPTDSKRALPGRASLGIATVLLMAGGFIFISTRDVAEAPPPPPTPKETPLTLKAPTPEEAPAAPETPAPELPPQAPETPATEVAPTPPKQTPKAIAAPPAPPDQGSKEAPAAQKERDVKKIGTLQKTNPLPPRVKGKRPSGDEDLFADLFGDTRKQESKMTLQKPKAIQSAHLPDGLTAESVLDVISNNSLSIKLCLDQAMRKGEKPKGRLDIKVTIAPTGAVQDVAITTPRFNHSTMARCTKKRIKLWRFPPFEGDPLPVEFPYVLSAGF